MMFPFTGRILDKRERETCCCTVRERLKWSVGVGDRTRTRLGRDKILASFFLGGGAGKIQGKLIFSGREMSRGGSHG